MEELVASIIIMLLILVFVGYHFWRNERQTKELRKITNYLDTVNEEALFNNERSDKEKLYILENVITDLENDSFEFYPIKRIQYLGFFKEVRELYKKSNKKTGQS